MICKNQPEIVKLVKNSVKGEIVKMVKLEKVNSYNYQHLHLLGKGKSAFGFILKLLFEFLFCYTSLACMDIQISICLVFEIILEKYLTQGIYILYEN